MTKRILIVRLSAIGDCILSVPVLNAIRRNFPTSRIGWVIERGASQLIQGHSALDDLFVVSKQTFQSPRRLWTLVAELRRWKPDTTIDLQGLTKSSIIAWLSGAKNRLGLQRDQFDGRELSCILNNRLYVPDSEHIVHRSLELLRLLGVNDTSIAYDLPEKEEDVRFAQRTIESMQIEGRFAIINVGAGWVSKVWPASRYAFVAKHIGEHWGIPSIVVWSGDQEKKWADAVVADSAGHASIAPPTTLLQLGCLIRSACLFVGSDTGPMHLSVAVGTSTVGLIGPMPIARVAPLGSQNVGLQNARLLRASDRKTDCGPMLSIDVDQVVQVCDQLLARQLAAKQAC